MISHLFTRVIKTVFLSLVLMVFTSYTPLDSALKHVLLEGTYSFRTTGDLQQGLQGRIDFEKGIEVSDDGVPFATLKLNLQNNEISSHHTMGFLISKENRFKDISEGTYNVKNSIDGFIPNFDGVFGFANVKRLGELPFFAYKGSITIDDIKEDTLNGSLRINMRNLNG
ncbi:MAG: hypothetical protein AAFO99_11410, partial [Bacteroidota bacterium]